MTTSLVRGALIVLPLAFSAHPASGSTPAFDSAADPAYNNGWFVGSNGGFGWGGPWTVGSALSGIPIPGGFVFTSANNGTGDLDNDFDINTPRNADGRAWGLTARAGTPTSLPGSAAGQRLLNGALSIGQIFRIDMDNGGLANPGSTVNPGIVGWGLFGQFLNSDDKFGVMAEAGKPDYLIQSDGVRDSGIPLTSEGIHCELVLLNGNNKFFPGDPVWIMTVTPLSPGSRTYTFDGIRQGTPVIGLSFGDSGGGFDPVFFNNISVGNVPEPGSVVFLSAGGTILLRRRRVVRN